MVYIPPLRMRVKTEVQSVIARTDSKDPDAGSKRGSMPASLTHPACTSLSPLSTSPIGNSRLVFGLGRKTKLTTELNP